MHRARAKYANGRWHLPSFHVSMSETAHKHCSVSSSYTYAMRGGTSEVWMVPNRTVSRTETWNEHFWCGREDLNLHGVAPTSTSSWRVYHSATSACLFIPQNYITIKKLRQWRILSLKTLVPTIPCFVLFTRQKSDRTSNIFLELKQCFA